MTSPETRISNYQRQIEDNKAQIRIYEGQIMQLEECREQLGVQMDTISETYPNDSQLRNFVNDSTIWNGSTRDTFEEVIPDVYLVGITNFFNSVEESRNSVILDIENIKDKIGNLMLKNIGLSAIRL